MSKDKRRDRVSVTVDVKTDRRSAFEIFTRDINAWWHRGPHDFYDARRAKAMRFEPGVGGRYLEVYDDNTGDALEIGRITVWEPGCRLVWRMSLDDTEVEVTFDATPDGTRVTLEQRLVPGGERADFYTGWHNIVGWFRDWILQQNRPASNGCSAGPACMPGGTK